MIETDELLERLRTRRRLPPPAIRQRIRIDAGASLRDVAAACGSSWSTVARWEAGSTPRGDRLDRYAHVLRELERVAE